MIPTIESIVEGLADGTYTKSQAVTWLHIHAEGAASDLRDHFAGLYMQGYIAASGHGSLEEIARDSYLQADAMLKARA